MNIDEVMGLAPVIPVLTLDGSLDPVRLAETLVEGGLPIIEVTLRTPSALAAIEAMSGVAGAFVGAGTVLNDRMLGEAIDAGARFIVSPGLTEGLGKAAIASGMPGSPAPDPTSHTVTPFGTTSESTAQFKRCRPHSRGTSRGPISPRVTPASARSSAYLTASASDSPKTACAPCGG